MTLPIDLTNILSINIKWTMKLTTCSHHQLTMVRFCFLSEHMILICEFRIANSNGETREGTLEVGSLKSVQPFENYCIVLGEPLRAAFKEHLSELDSYLKNSAPDYSNIMQDMFNMSLMAMLVCAVIVITFAFIIKIY